MLGGLAAKAKARAGAAGFLSQIGQVR